MARSPSSIINSEGLAADRAEWKSFARAIFFALVLPWLFIPLLLEWLGWQLGDTMPPARVAQWQEQHPTGLVYPFRSSLFARFKLACVAIQKPDILIIGQSRPQSFRSAMFRPYTAYNLGSLSYTIASFTDLLHHLPEGYNPKLIIVACDSYMFNPACTEANIRSGMLENFEPPSWQDHFNSLCDILVKVPDHPSLLLAGLHQPHAQPTMGLSAYLNDMGFRRDGSTKWYRETGEDNPHLEKTEPFWTNPIVQGDAMGKDEIAQFEQFVSECHVRGIEVVFVQMPMYGPVVHLMENEQAAKFGILREFQKRIADGYFDRLGVPTFDLLNLPGYSDNYHYFLDTVHPKEGLTLAALNAMAEDPRFLKLLPKLDVAAIKAKLQAQADTSHTNIYGNDF